MPRYWFRQKTFGYGSTPNTWQGWALTVAFIALVSVLAFGWEHLFATAPWVKGAALIGVGVVFAFVIYAKTEGGWRWRD